MLEFVAATDCVPSTFAFIVLPDKLKPVPAALCVLSFVGVTHEPSPRKKVVLPPPEGTIPNVEPPLYISDDTHPFAVTLK